MNYSKVLEIQNNWKSALSQLSANGASVVQGPGPLIWLLSPLDN